MSATLPGLARAVRDGSREAAEPFIGTIWAARFPSLMIDNDPLDRVEIVGVASDGLAVRPVPFGSVAEIDPAMFAERYEPTGETTRAPEPPPLEKSEWLRNEPRGDAWDHVVVEAVEAVRGEDFGNPRIGARVLTVWCGPVADLDVEAVPVSLAALEQAYTRSDQRTLTDDHYDRVKIAERRARGQA